MAYYPNKNAHNAVIRGHHRARAKSRAPGSRSSITESRATRNESKNVPIPQVVIPMTELRPEFGPMRSGFVAVSAMANWWMQS